MRKLLVATVAILALATLPALAITVNGDLGEWGVSLYDNMPTNDTGWLPTNGAGVALGDDVVHSDNSGGEWYDIEALYLNLNLDSNSIEWGMVTSYQGDDSQSGAALPGDATGAEQLRDGRIYRTDTAGDYYTAAFPWHRHPYLALSFNDDYVVNPDDPDAPPNVEGETWEYGIIMAPNSEDAEIGTGLTDAPELWAVNTWRGAHPNEFGPLVDGVTYHHNPVYSGPVDFDTRDVDDNSNAKLVTGGSNDCVAVQDTGYTEDNSHQVGATWYKSQNWVWEGTIAVPESVLTFTDDTDVEFTYALWCANNHDQADRISYGASTGDDSPEPATWALLLATVAAGGFARRRRKD